MSRLAPLALVLALVHLLVACGDDSAGGTSLQGSTACGTSTCASGQVCRDYPGSGIDAGTGGSGHSYDCVVVPSSCQLADCNNECAPCVDTLCSPTPAYSLTGRQLVCLVQ